jgi:hypothetical protein
MAAKRRGQKVRTADEFAIRSLLSQLRSPTQSSAVYSWDLAAIMSARDDQLRGSFRNPSRLAASMRTDDALFVAHKNRLAPQRALSVQLKPVAGGKGARVASEAELLFGDEGAAVSRETLADINSDLANHGIAVGYNEWIPRDDGSRVDVVHRYWPIEFVAWDSVGRVLYTETDRTMAAAVEPSTSGRGAYYVDIVHGDGRWVVYSAHEGSPWTKDAAVLPGGLVWARHAFAARDWAKGSASHGNAKVVGELPEGVPLQTDDGNGGVATSAEAAAFLALIQDVASLDSPAGIRPAGSKIDYVTNGSRAWEVWRELMANAEKAAARIYLGTDGILGAAGGAPGVDISALFGIATTILQADLSAIERGLRTGLIEPWTAVNFGDSSLAPRRSFVIPDPDAQRQREDTAKNEASLCAAIQARRASGFAVTQEWCDDLADEFGVARLELAAVQATGFQLAPTDLARVVTANEARATVGLPARDDGEVPVAVFGQPEPVPAAPAAPPALRAV